MYDYGKLVYLDNQKTGSTYVSKFLEACCSLPPVNYEVAMKHRPVRDRFSDKAMYFSTTREPFALYSSLFRYGQSGQGITWKKIKEGGRADLYSSFPAWLEFVLDEENALVFGRDYKRFSKLGVGVMSFRMMRISVKYPTKELLVAKSHDQLIDVWKQCKITDTFIKQEELNAGLTKLSTQTVPQYFNQDKVVEFLNRPERVNVTEVRAKLRFPPHLRKMIEDKERYLVDLYDRTPFWRGIYDGVISKFTGAP